MAGSKTNALAERWLDHEYNLAADYSPVATKYIALFTVAPGDAGGGTECTGAGYARTAIANDGTIFQRSGQVVSNIGTINCGHPTGGSWGTIVAAGLADTPTGPVGVFSDVTPLPTADGVDVILPAGEFTHSET